MPSDPHCGSPTIARKRPGQPQRACGTDPPKIPPGADPTRAFPCDNAISAWRDESSRRYFFNPQITQIFADYFCSQNREQEINGLPAQVQFANGIGISTMPGRCWGSFLTLTSPGITP